MRADYRSGFVTLTECGKINTDELSDRTEDSDHIEQATDDEEPDPDSSDNRGRTDCFRRHPGNPQGEK